MTSTTLQSADHDPRRGPADEDADASRRRSPASIVLALLFVAALGVVAWSWATWQLSSASFADTQRSQGNRLGAGTLDLAIGESTTVFTVENLAAGDSASGRLVLENAGSLPLRYTLASTAGASPLRTVLEVRAWNSNGSCPPGVPAGVATWDPLADAAELAEPAEPVIGSLEPGGSRTLCLNAQLPLSATSVVQGRRLDLIIGVDAEHDIDVDADPSFDETWDR